MHMWGTATCLSSPNLLSWWLLKNGSTAPPSGAPTSDWDQQDKEDSLAQREARLLGIDWESCWRRDGRHQTQLMSTGHSDVGFVYYLRSSCNICDNIERKISEPCYSLSLRQKTRQTADAVAILLYIISLAFFIQPSPSSHSENSVPRLQSHFRVVS